jgi:hypothetical protein
VLGILCEVAKWFWRGRSLAKLWQCDEKSTDWGVLGLRVKSRVKLTFGGGLQMYVNAIRCWLGAVSKAMWTRISRNSIEAAIPLAPPIAVSVLRAAAGTRDQAHSHHTFLAESYNNHRNNIGNCDTGYYAFG